MIALLLAGGPFMFATLGVSLVTIAIFLWRVAFFFGRNRASASLLAQVNTFIASASFSQAIEVCNVRSSPMARVLKAALLRANLSEKDIRRAVEAAAISELPKVKAGTVYLPQLSNLATLCGLIGTIHGLIVAFQGAGSESAATRQAILSKGIAIAFYNTFFGLTVATIGIVCYLLLLAKMNNAMALMEESAATVVDSIILQQRHQPRNQMR